MGVDQVGLNLVKMSKLKAAADIQFSMAQIF